MQPEKYTLVDSHEHVTFLLSSQLLLQCRVRAGTRILEETQSYDRTTTMTISFEVHNPVTIK